MTPDRSPLLLATAVLAVLALAYGGFAATTAAQGSNCTAFDGGVIDAPGCYELTGGTTDNASTYVTIAASNVTLYGNNHTVDGDHSRDRYGVYVTPGVSNVTVRNLTLSDWSRGVYVERASDVRVTNVTSTSNAYGISTFEGNTVRLRDVTSVDDQYPVRVDGTGGVTLRRATITENYLAAVEFRDMTGGSIENVAMFEDDDFRGGILVEDARGLTIRDNHFRNVSGGIDLRSVNRSTVANNTIENSPKATLGVSGVFDRSHNNSITNNRLLDSGPITVSETTDFAVRNNTITGGSRGIILSAGRYGPVSSNFTVADNLIENTTLVALEVNGASYKRGAGSIADGYLLNNTVRNGRVGVWLHSATNVTLRNNTIANHDLNVDISEDPDVQDESIIHFRHDIDRSNTVDGEPIRYIRGADGIAIDGGPTAQAVMLVDSENVTITNRTFANSTFLLANVSESTLRNVTVAGKGLRVHYSDNLTVDSATFDARSRDLRTASHRNLVIRNSRDVTVANARAEALGFGAVVTNQSRPGERVTLRNFTYALTNFNRGIDISNANATRILDSTINIGGPGIFVDRDATHTVIENTSVVHNNYGLSSSNAIEAQGSDTVLRNNTVRGYPGYGVYVSRPRPVIVGNRIVDSGREGVQIAQSATDARVEGNVIRDNGGGGLSVGTTRTLVANNTVAGNGGRAGIYLTGADDVTLRNNTVRDQRDSDFFRPEQVAGIAAPTDIQGLTIEGGALINNTQGIRLGRAWDSSRSTGAVVSDVAIRDSDVGIYLQYTASNTFRNLTIDGSAEWAVYAADAAGTAEGNAFANVTIDGSVRASWLAEEVAIAGTGIPPVAPRNYTIVGGALTIVNTTPAGYANLTVSYADADTTNANESTLALWRYDGAWAELPGSTLDTTAKTVSANLTAFSVFAPLAESTGPTPAPNVSVSPATLAFGNVTVGTSATATLNITNEGTADLTVSDVSMAGSDAAEFGEDGGSTTLAPGASTRVNVTFAPGSAGIKTANLSVDTDDPDESTVTVPVSGTAEAAGTPDIAVSPGSIDFGNVSVGASATASVTVTNEGTANLSVTGASIGGANASEFGTDAGAFLLAPGANRTVSVTFAPASAGDKSATLTVTSDDPDETPTVALAGTAPADAAPNLTVVPASVDFGTVAVGETATATVAVSNDGTADLTVNGITIAGANETEFAGGTGSFVLAPGESRGVTVAFAPATAGSKTADLVIDSGAPGTTTVRVALSGTAPDTTAPVLSNAGAFDLTDGDGSVADGDSVKLNVTATDDTGVASVTANASAFGAGTVTLSDSDGDGVYNATFTVGSEGSLAADGASAITFTASDAAGNTNTTTANLTIDTSTATATATAEPVNQVPGFGPIPLLVAALLLVVLARRRG